MARLSIVIPHWGTVEQLESTLVSVLENRPADAQILVVLNDIYDDPYDLKDEVSFVYAPIGTDAIRCVNLGVDAGQAPVVHVLSPGSLVSPGWADAAMARFADPQVGCVVPRMLDPADPQRIACDGLAYTAGGTVQTVVAGMATDESGSRPVAAAVGPDLRAAFYRKSLLTRVGRFSIDVGPELAAVDLALTLEAVGATCESEPRSRVVAGVSPPTTAGAFRRALWAERLFWRWAPRGGWIGSLSAHAGLTLRECGRNLPGPALVAGLAGRLLGFCQLSARAGHRRRLAACRRYLQKTSVAPRPHLVSARTPVSK